MVVTSLPAARETGATQERTASPSMCTVHAPHCAMPQPYLVPVSPRLSRSTHNNGVVDSTSTFTRRLFTEKEITRRALLGRGWLAGGRVGSRAGEEIKRRRKTIRLQEGKFQSAKSSFKLRVSRFGILVEPAATLEIR